ncbi:hypothetical protein [Hymenobacter tenuis]
MSQLFRVTFCDPFDPDILELGEMDQEQIRAFLDTIPWADLLRKMETRPASEIHFSPSLEVENQQKHGISISVAGKPDDYEFLLFYQRPKLKKYFFGLFSLDWKQYLSDISGQTRQDAEDCLEALLAGDLAYLDRRIR